MSFDVNVLSTKPIIKAAASMQNDGGGGNLGYMQQGQREEKEKRKYLDESIFLKQQGEDMFGFDKESQMPEEKFSLAALIAKIIDTVKNIWRK